MNFTSAIFTATSRWPARLDIQEQHRPDLIIIVMSATLNAEELEDYLSQTAPEFGNPAPCCVPKAAPIRWTSPICRIGWAQIRRRPGNSRRMPSVSFITNGGTGDVLVFMPGGFEISQTIQAIRNVPESRGYLVCRCTANFPRATRTPRSRATSSPKSSWPRTSPRRASRLTACAS
jgi:hypothetical protein